LIGSVFSIETKGDGYQLRMNVEKSLLFEQYIDFADNPDERPGFNRSEAFRLNIEGKLEHDIDVYGKIEQQSGIDEPLLIDMMAKKEFWSIQAGRFGSSINSDGIWLSNRTIDGGELRYADSVWRGGVAVSRSSSHLVKQTYVITHGDMEISLADNTINMETFKAEIDGVALVSGRDYILDHRRGLLKFTSRFWAERRLAGNQERGRLRIVYETLGEGDGFQAGRLMFNPSRSFSVSVGALNSSDFNGAEGSIAIARDSFLQFKSQGMTERTRDDGKYTYAGLADLRINPAKNIKGSFSAEISDSMLQSSAADFNTDAPQKYRAGLHADLLSGFRLDAEWEKGKELVDTIAIDREVATVRAKYDKGDLLSGSFSGTYEKNDTTWTLFSHADGGIKARGFLFSSGAEYSRESYDAIEKVPLFAKVSREVGGFINGAVRVSANGYRSSSSQPLRWNSFSANAFTDLSGKYGDGSLSGTLDLDTIGKPTFAVDGRTNVSGIDYIKGEFSLRGVFADSIWNSLLYRGDLRFNPSANFSAFYSPVLHRKAASANDSTVFKDIRHDGNMNLMFSKIRNTVAGKLSERTVNGAREEWKKEEALSDEIMFVPLANFSVKGSVSVSRERQGEKSSYFRESRVNDLSSSAALLFFTKSLGEFEVSGKLSTYDKAPLIEEGAAIDTVAVFKPYIDTFRNEFYYAKRIERKGTIDWKYSGSFLECLLDVGLSWDSDFKSPVGEEFGSVETWGYSPNIGIDYSYGEKVSIGLKCGGEWRSGYRKGIMLNSSLDLSLLFKYFRLNSSLYWEKEERAMGTANSVEWRIEGSIRL
jgi:hypothetical protein